MKDSARFWKHNSCLLESGLEMPLKEDSKVEEKDPKVWNVKNDFVVKDIFRLFYIYFNLFYTKSRNFFGKILGVWTEITMVKNS